MRLYTAMCSLILNKTFYQHSKVCFCCFISDTIKLMYRKVEPEVWSEVDLIRTGIAWDADKKYKFKNPSLGDLPNTPQNLEKGNLFIHFMSPPKSLLPKKRLCHPKQGNLKTRHLSIVITYSRKEVHPQCALLTEGVVW